MNNMATLKIRKAKQGRRFLFYSMEGEKKVYTVGRPCKLQQQGAWYCITHNLLLTSQIEKDIHVLEKGEHELAWICMTHGPEEPYSDQ